MIHAYPSIWRCLMHDIIIEIREKACVQNDCQQLYREYMKDEEGVCGALAPQKPKE